MKQIIKKAARLALPVITAAAVLCSSIAFAIEPIYAAEGYEKVSTLTTFKDILRENMEPVYAEDLKDGTYDIEVISSSSFFKILGAKLTVDGDSMQAKLLLNSGSYSCVYPGKGSEAAEAALSEYKTVEYEDSYYTVTIPVEALSTEIPCAAFSIKKQRWYDRNLIFDASTLPKEALNIELPEYGEVIKKQSAPSAQPAGSSDAAAIDLPDGEYSIEVTLTGGSGRASVSSPTWLVVKDGRAYAKLLWSSTYYDYMILDEVYYYNETTDGSNSTFTIPITAFDQGIEVIADTTAMGDPVEILYTLTFYEETVGDKGMVPQEAAKRVLLTAAAIIVLGGILNFIVKKKAGIY